MDTAPIYLFDGNCVLCSRAVAYVLTYEKIADMQFVAITSEFGRKLALENTIDPDNPSSFVYIENGQVFQKSDAALQIIRRTGGPARILLIGNIVPRAIRDFIYDRIAKNRYRIFGQTETCLVPDPETRKRFVLPSM